jgi:hypothetical protein
MTKVESLSVFQISICLIAGQKTANIASGKAPGDEVKVPPRYETHPNPTSGAVADVLIKLAAALKSGASSINQNVSGDHWIEQGP